MTDLVGHFLVFGLLAIGFLMAPLLVGRLVRPKLPTPEKDSIYECGEPAIGSSYIQFDLRFYVVALLFIIFDVEIAFFFPWASVYGSAMQLADTRVVGDARTELSARLLNVDPATLPAEHVISAADALKVGWIGWPTFWYSSVFCSLDLLTSGSAGILSGFARSRRSHGRLAIRPRL